MSEPTPDTILHQEDVEEVINKEIDEATVEERNTTKPVLAEGTAVDFAATVELDSTLIPDGLDDEELLLFVRRNHRIVQTDAESNAVSLFFTEASAEDGTVTVACSTASSIDFEIV